LEQFIKCRNAYVTTGRVKARVSKARLGLHVVYVGVGTFDPLPHLHAHILPPPLFRWRKDVGTEKSYAICHQMFFPEQLLKAESQMATGCHRFV